MKASKKKRTRSRAESRTSNLGDPDPVIIPKPHRTDHVLHSFFKDLFGKPEEIQLDTATSQDGVMATRDISTDPETVASDDELLNSLKHKIQLYKDLEKHLQQARTKALSEDEQHLTRMREQYPSCDNPSLMRHTSLISRHLDTALLREHGLVTPSDCLPASIPTRNTPPREEFPSYMDPTVTSELHATFKQNGDAIKDQSSQLVIPPKNHISSEERLQGQNALSELKRKTTFLHNPRQSAHKHTNTASNGLAKLRQGERREKEKDLNLFMAEPSELVFTDYSPGQSYEKFIDFRNISGASRQMRIVPPKSPYFKIKIAHFPNAEGVIAPGMTCTYSVKFFPDSLADFEDEIKVITQNGEQLTVTLKGYRPPPDLSVPSVLQCGHCLVGGHLLLTFPCLNNGGEGNFKLMTLEKEEGEGDMLCMGVFTISPTSFHLTPGASIELKVKFHPERAELYTYDFIMACDNGQCNTFTITGTGDMLSLCCVHVTQSADSILTANKYAESAGYYSLIESPVEVSSVVDGSLSVVEFDNTNPGIPVYKTVVIRNYSGVRLSYQWCYYHPRTELSHDTISPLVSCASCPFVLEDSSSSMELLSGEAKLIPLVYKPSKVSESHVMVLMELEGVPLSSLDHNEEGWGWMTVGQERVSPLCLELKGSADPYEVNISPPVICLEEGLAPCTEKKRTVKITNNSIGTVSFEWNSINQEQCTVVIEPSMGTIVSGGRQYCECTVSATSVPGPFSLSLYCNISNNEDNHTLHIKGHTQLPVVTTDCAGLCYGLIQLGHYSTVPLALTNHSKCSVEFQLKQIIDNENTEGVVNCSCLQFTPDHGVIPPNSSMTISTMCNPLTQCGRLRSAVELLVIGRRTSLIPVTGEIQRPSLVLEQSSLYLEDCYIGVPHTQSITIINRGLLPAQYEWIRDTYDHCELDYSPSKGLIGPKGRATIDITTTWNNEGYYTGVLAVCRVESMSEPLLLSLASRVKGLTVHYSLEGCNDAIMDNDLKLDFGSSNIVGVPRELCLVASNTSAVTTQLTVSVELFTAAQTGSSNDDTLGIRSARSLLRSTRNIADPTAKTDKQNKSDLHQLLLADGRGCCFALCPSQCTLLPFQSQTIKITAHSDMWGQYSDHLLCKVNGIVRYIPINYGVTGSPIVFPVTATHGQTIVRFGSQSAGAHSVKRSVKLTNNSSSDIRIDWRVFNYKPDDDKLIDLISYIGQPFPKLSANNVSEPVVDNETRPLVRAIIQPHEGVWSNGYPFTIEPQQMTISAKATSIVTIHFNPSVDSYNELGEHIRSYILGYYSLDNKSPVCCDRSSGYDVIPLKINITASIQHPKLILETLADDDSLSFTHEASELMKITDGKTDILSSVTLSHGFSLTNPTDSVLTFHISPPSQPFTLQKRESHITLKPCQKIEKSIGYCIDHCEILQQKGTQTIISADTMSVQFDTGAIQRFPIASRVHLPDISIHPTSLNFGMVHVLQSRSAAVQLRNNSHSQSMWKASIPQDTNGVISVTPMEGVLGVSESDTYSWVTTLNVTLTPGSETNYSIVVVLQELLTHSQLQLTVTGHGSADESVRVKRKKNKRL